MKVTSHIHELEPARELMKLGVDSLQHIPADEPVDDDFIALANERDVVVVPTLSLRKRVFQELPSQEFTFEPIEHTCGDPEVTRTWFHEDGPAGFDHVPRYPIGQANLAAENATALYEGGVAIAAGTDAGMMGMLLGASLHLELRALVEAGMPPEAVIVAATLNAARAAGKDDLYGSIEAGKFADLLVLAHDPLADIANVQAIELVVKHGKAFRQEELRPPGAGQILARPTGTHSRQKVGGL